MKRAQPKFESYPFQGQLPREMEHHDDLLLAADRHLAASFWELVDPGHVESADLSYSEYDGTGAWMGYLSCSPENVAENIERCRKVFEDVNANGITAEELEQARNKVASRIVLRGERPMGRLSSLGGNWMYRGDYRSISDDLKAVRSVTLDEIRQVLRQYPISMTTTVGVGPLSELQNA